MATVFLARLEGVAGFQRLFAIKRLHPHLANEAEFVDMFLDEARLAARIQHPNVVSILEVGTSAKGYYLVMEYIEGDTAARLLARSSHGGARLPVATAVRIALDTLGGLHAAHELTDDDNRPLCIVHRDVSPQNILVGVDGVARITDFGVAHAATRLSSTRTGQLKGKLAYMAPEQARGAIVDRRSDVFAMGVVLWEMLAGRRLFKASNDGETLHRILFAPVPTLRGAGVDVPVPLDAVCMRALERDPDARYASAAEFGDDLERVARATGLVSSTREVAAYVDGAIGAEISQQREVVRAWLSRSEPSRNDRRAIAGLEGAGAERGSPDGGAARPSSKDVTLVEGAAATGSRPDVSSVSAAVFAVVPEPRASAPGVDAGHVAAPLEPFAAPDVRSRRRGVWAIGLLSALVVALSVALVAPRYMGSRAPLTPDVLPEPLTTTPPVVVAPPRAELPSAPVRVAVPVPVPVPSAPSASVAPVTPTPEAQQGPAATRGTRPAPAATPARPSRPARPPRADDPGDDISRNPYR